MRLLTIHADRFAFAVTGEASVAGFSSQRDASAMQAHLDEVLVAFVAVEKGDQFGPQDVASQAARLNQQHRARRGRKADHDLSLRSPLE